MEILCHRGLWKTVRQKNTSAAFEEALTNGFGIETDIRDYCGRLVISHDIPNDDALQFDDFIKMIQQYADRMGTLALNVKSDGLQELLSIMIKSNFVHRYFLFDMSIPEMTSYIKNGFVVYGRMSDLEEKSPFYADTRGLWFDSFFTSDWITKDILSFHLDQGKRVCLVSPELHSRDHLYFWKRLKDMDIIHHPEIMLCTDFPEEARRFFGE